MFTSNFVVVNSVVLYTLVTCSDHDMLDDRVRMSKHVFTNSAMEIDWNDPWVSELNKVVSGIFLTK